MTQNRNPNPIYLSEVMFEGKGGAVWMEGYDYSNVAGAAGRYSNATGLATAQETVADLSKKLGDAVKTRDSALQSIENIRAYLSTWLNMPGDKFALAIPYDKIMIGDPNKGAGTASGNWISGWNPWLGSVYISQNYSYRTGLPHIEAQYNKSSDSGKKAINNAFLEDKVKKLQDLNKAIVVYNNASKDVNSFTESLKNAQLQLDKISATDPTTIRVKAEAQAVITKGLEAAKSQKWIVLAGIGIIGFVIVAWVGKRIFFSKA